MIKNRVEVIIQPVTLRFRLYNDEICYLFAGSADAQLDDAELMLGINPKESTMLDSNLGFLPVCSTVLIRGEKTILFDPNNMHVGFYGPLEKTLAKRGLTFADIDTVVVSHWHHDHSANVGMISAKELVVGDKELDWARGVYGEESVATSIKGYDQVTEICKPYEIAPGITAMYTPGHTPGSISLFVEGEEGKTIIAGDTIMVKKEWLNDAAFSHWYTEEQLQGLKAAAKLMRDWQPDKVIPGHDRIIYT